MSGIPSLTFGPMDASLRDVTEFHRHKEYRYTSYVHTMGQSLSPWSSPLEDRPDEETMARLLPWDASDFGWLADPR